MRYFDENLARADRARPEVAFLTKQTLGKAYFSLGELEAAVERRGGTVISSHAINRRHAVDGVAAIVSDLQRQLIV